MPVVIWVVCPDTPPSIFHVTVLVSIVVPAHAVCTKDNDRACRTLLELLERLYSKNMLADVQAIHLEDASRITVRYLDRFNVVIPWDADMDYKLNYLLAVVEKLEDNERGTINMTQDRKVNFIPE